MVRCSYEVHRPCIDALLLPQLLQGELDSLKAERGKAQRKNLEVGLAAAGCNDMNAVWSRVIVSLF